MTPEQIKQMSEIMRNLSAQMTGMSDVMQRGRASEEEMHQLHMKINATKKSLEHIH